MEECLSNWEDTDSKYQHRIVGVMIGRMGALWSEANSQLARGVDHDSVSDILEECAALGAAIALLEESADLEPMVLQ